jgi:ABC-2 type transport system permease protein
MPGLSALLKKNVFHVRNTRRILKDQSVLKIAFILSFAFGLEYGLFRLFLSGFVFLDQMGGVGLMIVNRLFSLFFLGLGLMLVVSNFITSYATLFRSDDIHYLVSQPLEFSQIAVFKFIDSSFLSSWAFFTTIIPFVGAYAWHEGLSPLFILWTFIYSLPFLALCCAIGTVITMIFVRILPKRRHFRYFLAAFITIAVIATWQITKYLYKPDDEFQLNIARLVPGIELAAQPLLPSFWISEGIQSLVRGDHIRGLMMLLLLITTAAMLTVVIEWLGKTGFYETWQKITFEMEQTKRKDIMFPRLYSAMAGFSPDVRAIILKDIRTFFRDPAQWSQFFIFFGLLGFYFANLRSFNYHILPENWRITMAFLNVFSVSAVMCSMGSRFIYPQLSLEGQAFWILGLAPTSMRRILITKFCLAWAGMTTVSVVLMLLSSSMLNASMTVRFVSVLLAVATSTAICGSSTGLGAIYMDLDQRNPAAIVSGFGGTLNLVISMFFMLASITPYGMAFHWRLVGKLTSGAFNKILALSTLWLIIITIAATILPLILGNRSLKNRDF